MWQCCMQLPSNMEQRWLLSYFVFSTNVLYVRLFKHMLSGAKNKFMLILKMWFTPLSLEQFQHSFIKITKANNLSFQQTQIFINAFMVLLSRWKRNAHFSNWHQAKGRKPICLWFANNILYSREHLNLHLWAVETSQHTEYLKPLGAHHTHLRGLISWLRSNVWSLLKCEILKLTCQTEMYVYKKANFPSSFDSIYLPTIHVILVRNKQLASTAL